MFGIRGIRVRRALLAGALMLVSLGALPTAASLAGPLSPTLGVICTDSWNAAVSGSWSDATKWSAGRVPSSSDDVCIKRAGTYTVTENATSTVSVHSLQLGGTSGTATLSVANACSVAALQTTAGLSVAIRGAVVLDPTNSCFFVSEIAGPVENAGTITSTTTGSIQGAQFAGDVTNDAGGTIAVDAGGPLSVSGPATFTNNGMLSLDDTMSVFGSGSTFVNGSGGSISGSAELDLGVGVTMQEAGAISGPVVTLQDGALEYTGSGPGAIEVFGSTSLSGNLAAGQILDILAACGTGASDVTASADWTNAGTISLSTLGGSCEGRASLSTTGSHTLTSTGTINIVNDVPHGETAGDRYLQGSLVNDGTINVDYNTSEMAFDASGSTLTNNGTLNLAGQLSVLSGATFVNATAGLISATTTGQLFVLGGTLQEAGTVSGSPGAAVANGTLDYIGSGPGTIRAFGATSVSGDVAAGQEIDVLSNCSTPNTNLTAAGSWSNAGTIVLASQGPACANAPTLTTSSGFLTNTGQIALNGGPGSSPTLAASIANSGTITVPAAIEAGFTTAGAVLSQDAGSISIGNGGVFKLDGGGQTVKDNGGTIAGEGTGQLFLDSGTWDQGAGATTGTQPVIVNNSTLNYVGAGHSTITAHGNSNTISGNLAVGQKLVIENTCASDATVSASAGFFSKGTIQLQSGSRGCANNSLLSMPGLTLTNQGTLATALGKSPGTFKITGSVSNAKTVATVAGRDLGITGGYTVSTRTATTKIGLNAGGAGHLIVGGTAALNGTLAIARASAYHPSAGTDLPVISSGVSRTGTFAKETGDAINTGGLYFLPSYGASAVDLVATQAQLSESITSGSRGASVTLTGLAYPPGDTITPTFKDAAGTVTTYTHVTSGSSGGWSTTVTVPSGAALGNGQFAAKSTYAGITLTQAFAVTS